MHRCFCKMGPTLILGTALALCACDDELEDELGEDRSAAETTPGRAPGQDCHCDDQCRDEAGCSGLCVFGVCMTRPCVASGAGEGFVECPRGSHAVTVYEYGGVVCYPECATYPCRGHCDRQGTCRDTEDTDFACDPSCASYCSDDSV